MRYTKCFMVRKIKNSHVLNKTNHIFCCCLLAFETMRCCLPALYVPEKFQPRITDFCLELKADILIKPRQNFIWSFLKLLVSHLHFSCLVSEKNTSSNKSPSKPSIIPIPPKVEERPSRTNFGVVQHDRGGSLLLLDSADQGCQRRNDKLSDMA